MRLTTKITTGIAGAIIITSLGAASALAASASAPIAARPVPQLAVHGNVSVNFPGEVSGATKYPSEVSG